MEDWLGFEEPEVGLEDFVEFGNSISFEDLDVDSRDPVIEDSDVGLRGLDVDIGGFVGLGIRGGVWLSGD